MRRVFSFALGVGLGATLAFLLARSLKRARARIPEALASEAREVLNAVREAISKAAEEGRRAMKETEESLRVALPRRDM